MDRNLKNNLSVLFLFLLLLLVLANNPANANEYDEEYSDAYTEKPLPQGQPFASELSPFI